MADKNRAVLVQSMGIIMPDISSCKDIGNCYNTGISTLYHSPEVKNKSALSGISERETRRMAHLTNLALYAAEEAFSNIYSTPRNGAIFVGLTHGSTSLLCEFHDYLFDFGLDKASPNAFSNGVTNAPLGALSKYLNLTEGGSTLVGYENCGMDVLNSAAFSLQNNIYSFCLAGAAEEYSPVIEKIYSQCGWFKDPEMGNAIPPGLKNVLIEKKKCLIEGSVFFSLSSENIKCDAGNKSICYFKPVENIHDINDLNIDIDLIISGMYGISRDAVEFEVISDIISRQKRRPVLIFSKLLFGESFAVGALLSSAIAWDILVNSTPHIFYGLKDKKNIIKVKNYDSMNIRIILVISVDRNNKVSAGIFSKNLI